MAKKTLKNDTLTDQQDEIATLKAQLQQMTLANEELSDFIENAALPLHWVNSEGIITWANQAELTALGFEREEYIGQPIANFHADQPTIDDILARLKDNQTLHNYRARLKCKDGTIKHVLISSNVLRKEETFVHTRCFTRDITAMVLEEQRRNDFVSMVSHELKTPLTSILGYLQLMVSKSAKFGDAFFTQALAKTEKQAKGMKRMIEDFLIISRLEEAKLELRREVFELHILLNELIQDFQLLKGHHDLQLQHDGQVYLYADRSKIAHVLVNLIGNAIKYTTKKTKIVIGCQQQKNQVRVYVKDQGVGISKSDQKHLFERFYRAQTESTRHISGFGIGLYLASEILRYHDSDLRVDSSLGKGSTFYFLLPVHIRADQNFH